MPREIEYVVVGTSIFARIRVRFTTHGANVTTFLVQLEALDEGRWKPVQRFDDSHGRPHRDYLDRWGREYRKEWLDMDRNSALTTAIDEFKASGRHFVIEFLRGEHNG